MWCEIIIIAHMTPERQEDSETKKKKRTVSLAGLKIFIFSKHAVRAYNKNTRNKNAQEE